MGLLTVAAAVPAAAGAAPAEGWGPRQVANRDHAESRHVDSFHELAVTADGTAVAVWQAHEGDRYVIQGARRPSGGDWSEPVVLAGFRAIGGPGLNNMFVDDAGNATIGWTGLVGRDTYTAMVRTWRADGSLGSAVELDRLAAPYGAYVYGNPEGDLLAVTRFASGTQYTHVRPLGGSWSGPTRFPDATTPASVEFVLDPAGRVDALWSAFRAAPDHTVLRSSLVEGRWTTPLTVAPANGQVWDIDADRNAAGDVGVVWSRVTPGAGTDDFVMSAYRPAGGGWQPAQVAHRARQDFTDAVEDPQVGVDAAGDLTAVWREEFRDTVYDDDVYAVRGADRPASGGWSAAQRLADRCGPFSLQLSVNAGGGALASCEVTTDFDYWIWAVHRPAGGSWRPLDRLTPSLGGLEQGYWSEQHPVLADAGEAVVTFMSTNSNRIWSRARTIG